MAVPSFSNASIVSIKGAPAFSVYSASKAAVRSFARGWSVDLKDRKIRVNVVSPGTVPSPGYKNSLGLTDEQIKQFSDGATGSTPLGRVASSYVNAIELFVDGGQAQI